MSFGLGSVVGGASDAEQVGVTKGEVGADLEETFESLCAVPGKSSRSKFSASGGTLVSDGVSLAVAAKRKGISAELGSLVSSAALTQSRVQSNSPIPSGEYPC